MRWLRPLALAVALGAAAAPVASGKGGLFDRPDREVPAPKLPSETVAFATADAVLVPGTYWPGGEASGPALVLVPMEGTTRQAYEPLVPALVEHGIAALAIDLRSARSERSPDAKAPPALPSPDTPEHFATMHEDVQAAVRFLVEKKGRDPKRIGLVGAGVGSAVALDAARRLGLSVHALMLLTPSLTYPGLPSEEHAKEVPGAVHVILLAAVADMDKGARRLLYNWERERNPPPLTAKRRRQLDRRGVIPRIRALVDPAAVGTRMFGRVPHLESWVGAWFARLFQSYPRPVLYDGSVDPVGDYGDPSWNEGTPLPAGETTGRALRWGRRVMVGAEVPKSATHVRVRVALRRGGRQVDIGAIVQVPSGQLQAAPLTLRTDVMRPSVPITALALEGQDGYEGVAPVKPSFEVEIRFPEIEDVEGPYEVRAAMVVESGAALLEESEGIDPAAIDSWPVVPDSLPP